MPNRFVERRITPPPGASPESASCWMTGPFGNLRVTPLIRACAEGDLSTVTKELSGLSRAELWRVLSDTDDWAGSTALHWAAYAGSAPIVVALLRADADPESRNTRDEALPLHLAARYNQSSEALEELVRAAPGTMNAVNSRGNTPLHETAYEGRVASASKLLSFGPRARTDAHSFFLRARPAHWPPPLTTCVPPPRRR